MDVLVDLRVEVIERAILLAAIIRELVFDAHVIADEGVPRVRVVFSRIVITV